jgi:hypothetical protein
MEAIKAIKTIEYRIEYSERNAPAPSWQTSSWSAQTLSDLNSKVRRVKMLQSEKNIGPFNYRLVEVIRMERVIPVN